MIEKLKSAIESTFGPQSILAIRTTGLQPELIIEADKIVSICQWLRDHKSYYFDFLSNITAVDYYPENKFAVVYNLASIPFQEQLTLRIEIENDRNPDRLPVVPSVSAVWQTANWHEREAFDLMGVYFEGHPDLRRILLPDDWQGFPLRKDYQDAETYHGIAIK